MAKMRFFGICILLVALLFCAALPVQAALADTQTVLLLSGEKEGNEIVVTLSLQSNAGISGMNLTIDYDRSKLTLVGCERGSALPELNFLPTGTYDTDDFTLNWIGDDDTSTGRIATLRFTIKEGANGQTIIRLKKKEAIYTMGGDPQVRNIVTNSLQIDLSSGEATHIETIEESDDAQVAPAPEEKKSNTRLIVGIAVGGTFAILLIVGIPWLVVRKKRV